MPPKAKAKTYSTDWRSVKATDAAVTRFKDKFEKAMGAPLLIGRQVEPYRVIPSGSLVLDAKLGVGGWVVGRVHELWGPDGAGKTSLAILAAVEAQRTQPDKMVGWVDMEQNFDVKWAVAHGLSMDRVMFYTPKTAEDTADGVFQLVESGLCSWVVLDSVGGMVARMEMQKNADEETVGLVPKIVTRAVKTASPMAATNGTTVMVLNQVRARIGGYGPDTTSGGGWALKHVTTCKGNVRRGAGESLKAKIFGEDLPVGHTMVVKVERNKVYPQGEVAEIIFRNRASLKHGPIGVDKAAEAVEVGLRFGVVEQQPGGYYVGPDGQRIKGRDTLLEHFRDHPDVVEQVRTRSLEALASDVGEQPEEPEVAEGPDADLDWSEASA